MGLADRRQQWKKNSHHCNKAYSLCDMCIFICLINQQYLLYSKFLKLYCHDILCDIVSGLERVRTSVSGGPLPSARLVSTAIHVDRHSDLTSITHMVMQWGQFLDHDLTCKCFVSVYKLLQYQFNTLLHL
jgi:hypothetical protein